MSAVQAHEARTERRTSPIELLWDLVFVFAITQVTTLLSHDLGWRGLGRSMLVLALVWWAWSAFVWAANAEQEEAPPLRLILLLAMVLIFIAGLAIPRAFGGEATLFAATYAGVRLLHLGLYADASRRGHAAWSAIAGTRRSGANSCESGGSPSARTDRDAATPGAATGSSRLASARNAPGRR